MIQFPETAQPYCELSIVRKELYNYDWLGCKEIVGECGRIRDSGACPKLKHTGAEA